MSRTQLGLAACGVVWVCSVLAQTTAVGDTFLDVQIPTPPVIGRIEGQPQLIYELHMTNFRPAAVTLTRIDVLRGTRLLHSSAGIELTNRLGRVGARPQTSDLHHLAGGQRAVFYAWLPLPHGELPSDIHHRISFRTDDGSEHSVDATEVRVVQDPPIELGPPLRGGPWVAVYDPGLPNGHRRVILAISGKARIPARFAVDWIKLGPDGRFSHGDPSIMANSYSYGEDVLAVADAVVVGVEDNVPEPTPNISIKNEAGNYISLDLGGNRFAFYEHLKPGSIRVKLDERVRTGQVVGAVGASGSVSSGAHLHFHVADANTPLAAEGLPFVFRSYQRLGSFPSFEALGRPWMRATGETPASRSVDTPAPLTVVSFH